MTELKAWVMVGVRMVLDDTLFSVGNTIRDKLGLKAMEVVGLYDLVAEVAGESLEEIYQKIKLISNLESVASATTYVSIARDQKTNKNLSDVCLLIDTASQKTEYVWRSVARLDAVQEADIVLGVFDVIAMANVPMSGLAEFLNSIHRISGVIRVIAMPAFPKANAA